MQAISESDSYFSRSSFCCLPDRRGLFYEVVPMTDTTIKKIISQSCGVMRSLKQKMQSGAITRLSAMSYQAEPS